MERNWRDGKPKWVVEDALSEINSLKIRLALRWPDETKPTPVPFQWGEYDLLRGEPSEGTYWSSTHRGVGKITIRKKVEGETGWQTWRFSTNGGDFTTFVVRGKLYETEKDAALAHLWEQCEEAAVKLDKAWERLLKIRGHI